MSNNIISLILGISGFYLIITNGGWLLATGIFIALWAYGIQLNSRIS